MFDLQKSSLFFEQMGAAHPTLVQNIEIVHENKLLLDAAYHVPKRFILHLNNLLRSLLFFIENSIKNSPVWLHDAVTSFKNAHEDQFEKLRYLRNVSAHQKLVFPDESIVVGLFRLRSSGSYVLKLGFGDHNKPGKYAWDLALKNTDEIFHDMLAFSSITFMDLEHSSLGECLGITRRWYFKVKFKSNSRSYNEVLDVYDLCSTFSAALLDHVCNAYAAHKSIKFDGTFSVGLAEHNHINTLLELDLYPTLFSEWWEDKCNAMNFGVRSALHDGAIAQSSDEFHTWVFANLSPDIATYKKSLERFATLEPKDIFEKDTFGEFLSFITVNHWHFKRAFNVSIMNSPISPSDIMMLQRYGGVFIDEYRKEKLCTIQSSKEQLNAQIRKMLKAIDERPTNDVEI